MQFTNIRNGNLYSFSFFKFKIWFARHLHHKQEILCKNETYYYVRKDLLLPKNGYCEKYSWCSQSPISAPYLPGESKNRCSQISESSHFIHFRFLPGPALLWIGPPGGFSQVGHLVDSAMISLWIHTVTTPWPVTVIMACRIMACRTVMVVPARSPGRRRMGHGTGRLVDNLI